jgi:hypothetical protein
MIAVPKEPATSHRTSWLMRESYFSLENDPELIGALVDLLLQELDGMNVGDGAVRMRVGVALQEALSNALYHGNLEVSSDLRQYNECQFYALGFPTLHRQSPFRRDQNQAGVASSIEPNHASLRMRSYPGISRASS